MKKTIRLFISDIDGVWTDGGMYYDNTGNELKKYNTSDSAGVAFLKLLKIPFAIMSGEKNDILVNRAKKLNIDRVHLGIKNKLGEAQDICEEMGITLDDVAFIGDDLNDLPLLEKVGLSAAPANAPEYIRSRVSWSLPVKGGDGAFRCFVEKYLTENGLMDEAIRLFLENLNQTRQ